MMMIRPNANFTRHRRHEYHFWGKSPKYIRDTTVARGCVFPPITLLTECRPNNVSNDRRGLKKGGFLKTGTTWQSALFTRSQMMGDRGGHTAKTNDIYRLSEDD